MESIELLKQWHTGVRIRHTAHNYSAVSFERRARFLGVPVIAFSTAVGTTLFAGPEISPTFKTVAGLLSFAAAVMSSIQTSLNYSDVAAKHKVAAHKYGQLRRNIEVYLARYQEEQLKISDFLEKIQKEWDILDEQSPNIPQRFYDRSFKEFAPQRATAGKS